MGGWPRERRKEPQGSCSTHFPGPARSSVRPLGCSPTATPTPLEPFRFLSAHLWGCRGLTPWTRGPCDLSRPCLSLIVGQRPPLFAPWCLSPHYPEMTPLNSDDKGCVNASDPRRTLTRRHQAGAGAPRPSGGPQTSTAWLSAWPTNAVESPCSGTEAPHICPPRLHGLRGV